MRPQFVRSLVTACALSIAMVTVTTASVIQTDPSKQNKEWIAIVPTFSTASVTPLLDYRISQGRSGCIWTFSDLSDSYGGFGPNEIRAALQEAWSTWTVRPRWVCIFADHKAGEDSYVFGRVGDLGFANQELGRWEPYVRGLLPLMDVTGDSLPDIAVGRVPTSNSAYIANYVAKVIAHDQDVIARAGYRSSVMLVEDQNVAGNDSIWVRHLADSLYHYWDGSFGKLLLHYSDFGCCVAPQRQAAIDAWDSGPGMVLAMGNGSNWFELVGFWETCALTNAFHVADLAAAGTYPALLALSCGVNATDQPVLSSCDQQGVVPLTEQLLGGASDRGASVVIAPMRNTIQYWDFFLGKHLLTRKAMGDHTWGELLVNAMSAALQEDPASYDHVFQFTLAGDPAAQANPGDVSSVDTRPSRLVDMSSPYPSPTAQGAQIQFNLQQLTHVELTVNDVAGRLIRSLVDEELPAGSHLWSWDLIGDDGARVRPGVFFLQLRCDQAAIRRRIVVVR